MLATWTSETRSHPPEPASPIVHTEDTFTGKANLRLFTQTWRPEIPARAAVIIVHGYAEHSSRYHHVAAHLVRHGLAVHTYDQRGYGRSEGQRAFVRSFDEYVDDLATFMALTRKATADIPLLIFGHSLGGLIGAYYCLQREPAPDGLILSSPAIDVGQDVPLIVLKMATLISLLAPALPTIALDLEDLSSDSEVVANARRDPLRYHGRMPARLGSEIMRAARFVQEHSANLRLPMLILHGTADRIAGPTGSWKLHGSAESPDKSLHLYEGLYHETFNEPQKRSVLEDVTHWISHRL